MPFFLRTCRWTWSSGWRWQPPSMRATSSRASSPSNLPWPVRMSSQSLWTLHSLVLAPVKKLPRTLWVGVGSKTFPSPQSFFLDLASGSVLLRHWILGPLLRLCLLDPLLRHCLLGPLLRHCLLGPLLRHCLLGPLLRYCLLGIQQIDPETIFLSKSFSTSPVQEDARIDEEVQKSPAEQKTSEPKAVKKDRPAGAGMRGPVRGSKYSKKVDLEIARLRSPSSPEFLIPRALFCRLVADTVSQDLKYKDIRISGSALKLLQWSSEAHISTFLSRVNAAAAHASRATVTTKDFLFVSKLGAEDGKSKN